MGKNFLKKAKGGGSLEENSKKEKLSGTLFRPTCIVESLAKDELRLRMYPQGRAPPELVRQIQETKQAIEQLSIEESRPLVIVSEPVASPRSTDKASDNWSPSLRRFVERCFSSCNSEAEKSQMQAKLTDAIQRALHSGHLHGKHWDTEPIPRISVSATNEVGATKPQAVNAKLAPDRIPLNSTVPRIPAFGDQAKKKEREEKFQREYANHLAKKGGASATPVSDFSEESCDLSAVTVVGTCQDLEKSYLRLTAPPEPHTVRPLSVLKKTLLFLKDRWRSGCDYAYICDQFKSLRQDLTVQHIKSGFTIAAYEIHARIALEKGDLGEYNQCQTQLKSLYFEIGDCPEGHPNEFIAYRILYLLHTRDRASLGLLLKGLTPSQMEDSAISHSLALRKSLITANYRQFFRLCQSAPNMGFCLIENFLDRERIACAHSLCLSFRPSLPVDFLRELLAFDSDSDVVNFFVENGAAISNNSTLLTKESVLVLNEARSRFRKIDIRGQM